MIHNDPRPQRAAAAAAAKATEEAAREELDAGQDLFEEELQAAKRKKLLVENRQD